MERGFTNNGFKKFYLFTSSFVILNCCNILSVMSKINHSKSCWSNTFLSGMQNIGIDFCKVCLFCHVLAHSPCQKVTRKWGKGQIECIPLKCPIKIKCEKEGENLKEMNLYGNILFSDINFKEFSTFANLH